MEWLMKAVRMPSWQNLAGRRSWSRERLAWLPLQSADELLLV
jgi:hypothetical protein